MRISILTVILFVIIITGCQKEINFESPAGITDSIANPSLALRRLKAYTILEGTDTVAKFAYTYDSGGRIIRDHSWEYFGNISNYEYDTRFSYASNDSLQSLIKFYETDQINNTIDSTFEYFFYNTSRKLIRDSLIRQAGTLVYYYEYLPSYVNVSSDFGLSQHVYQTVNAGNIITETDSLFHAGIFNSKVTNTYTFDSRHNPFLWTGIKRSVIFNAENPVGDFSFSSQKNNLLERQFTWPGVNADEHYTYSYIYDTLNFPLSVTVTELLSGNVSRGIYTY